MSEPTGDKPPLEYQAPGAPDAGRPQWITDEHPGGSWLVGCLLVLTGCGAVIGTAWWYLSSWAGWGLGI